MLRRQKIVLAVLAESRTSVTRIRLVKTLFLLRKSEPFDRDDAFYDFVPYKYGPFSFALYRELSALEQYGFVTATDERVCLKAELREDCAHRIEELREAERASVKRVIREIHELDDESLIRQVYAGHPWYAVNSEYRGVRRAKTSQRPIAEPAVYTVGYEGRSIDGFFDHLLRNGMETILDVRANPVSRKYGFAKRSLSRTAASLGITYHHLPEFGISSELRSRVSGVAGFRQLFLKYEQEILPACAERLPGLAALVRDKASVLLCKERDPHSCHRNSLAKRVADETGLPVRHL